MPPGNWSQYLNTSELLDVLTVTHASRSTIVCLSSDPWVVLPILLLWLVPWLPGCGGGDKLVSPELETVQPTDAVANSEEKDESDDLTIPNSDLTVMAADLEVESESAPAEVQAKLLREQDFQSEFSSGEIKLAWRAKVYSDNSSKKHGLYVEYYKDGQEFVRGEYTDDKRTGHWTYYDKAGGVAKQGNYAKGQLDGTWSYYRKNGAKVREAQYVVGVKHGTWKYYSQDGEIVIRELSFVDGKMHGMAKEWHLNGQLAMEVDFVDDSVHGQRRRWYDMCIKINHCLFTFLPKGSFANPVALAGSLAARMREW